MLRRRVVAGQGTTGGYRGTHRKVGKSAVSAYLYWSRQELRTQNTSGASNTEPTVAMLARRRNTSPILRIITEGKTRENNSKVDKEENSERSRQTFVG